jgi:hypothetical protein
MTGMRLFTMNTDGSNQQPLQGPQFLGNFYSRPSYSPDGSKIIFVYGADVTAQTIWTANADGTNYVKFPTGFSTPTYSPDGRKVAYSCCLSATRRIRTIDADGNSNSVQILTPSAGQNSEYPDWQQLFVTRRTMFDFDGDGRADIAVFRPTGAGDPNKAYFYVQPSQSGSFRAEQFGREGDVPVPADYDGDLKTDFAVWRPSDRNFYILNSFDNTFRVENFGLSGDIPTGGDWDADGKADPAVYRAGAQSFFYYRGSMGNPQGNITAIHWGTSGDKPVAGDYDGDGLTDAAVYRNGTWFVRQSSNGQLSASNFGLADDKLVPADYDADGKTDLAVYRGGIWYLLRSAQGFAAFQFGISNDTPAPADFDGDGKTDLAVYRGNTWYLLQSTNGFTGMQFGATDDKPIPSAFVR